VLALGRPRVTPPDQPRARPPSVAPPPVEPPQASTLAGVPAPEGYLHWEPPSDPLQCHQQLLSHRHCRSGP
jgi:hypothetical protein